MDNKLLEYILKHSSKRDRELKYDFMPSLLEIIERPAHKAGKIIIWGIFSLLIVGIMWAAYSKIDVVVTTSGIIKPMGELSILKAYDTATVKNILVNEGENVKEGTVLIEFDEQSLSIDTTQLESQRKQLVSRKEAYELLIDEDAEHSIDVSSYDLNVQSYISTIVDLYESYQNTIEGLEKKVEIQKINMQIAERQLEEYRIAGTKAQRETQQLLVKQYEVGIEEAEITLKDKKITFDLQVNSEIADLTSQIEKIDVQLDQHKLSKEYQVIKAPVNGHINQISVNTIGDVVSLGQELISILPADTPMEMVCYISNKDIADISTDMNAEIKLEAYSYDKYGTVKGKIKYISPSTFTIDKLGNVYLVKVEICNIPEGVNIISGLQGNVEIKTGKRSILDYFLEPIMKGFGESLKEK